jgi:CheY-like chemotaxis protein
MEAVGQLTGGVAHDFNNLLTVITANLDLIEARAGSDVKLRKLVDAAQRAAGRGQQLTSQLLAFARRQALRPETVCVNELITELLALARRATGEAITIELALDPALWSCQIDPAQFEAAVLNLVVNARDAMPAGGRVRIETRNITLGRRAAAAIPALPPGPYVLVSVSDNGTGMPAAVLQHAMEPFFTTKEIGKGTGLGLSQVYGFVRQSGGQVQIDSAPGRGTTVRLYLPRSDAVRERRPETSPQRRATHGSERVLVVEDDADVREVVRETLSSLGYHVFVTNNGPEALKVLEHDGPFDLLFTDLVMPNGMSGLELARAARQRCPELRVLLTSGYAPDPALSDELQAGRLDILRKPYRQTTLAMKVRAALESERARPDP